MKHEAVKAGLNLSVSSAGTAAVNGERASENARLVASRLGLSLSAFRSKPVTERRVKLADLVLTMTKAQKQEVIQRWQDAKTKTYLISEFSGSGRRAIDDPLGGPLDDYLILAAQLKDETKRIVRKLARARGRSAQRRVSRRKRRR